MPDSSMFDGNDGETEPDEASQQSGASSLAGMLRPLRRPARLIALIACLILLLLLAMVTGWLPLLQGGTAQIGAPASPARPSETPA